MLTRLIKHEFKATGRVFIPMIIMLIGVSLLTRLFLSIPFYSTITSIIGMLLQMLCYFLIVAALAICLILCVKRFKSNLTGDEGYLMLTLPAAPSLHVAAKLLTSVVWVLVSALSVAVSAVVLNYYNGLFRDIGTFFATVADSLVKASSLPLWVFIVMLVFLVLVLIIINMLAFYTSIAVGQLSNSHKTLFSFITYFALYVIMQFINTFILMVYYNNFRDLFESVVADTSIIASAVMQLLAAFGIVFLLCSAALYVLTSLILSKKLNLE